jgi:sulfur-carrier protein
MAVSVLVPTPLRKFTNEQDTGSVEPGTIATLVSSLEQQFPGIAARLTGEDGELRKFINIYVNEEDIRFLDGKDTPINDGDEVSIVPAIAGG